MLIHQPWLRLGNDIRVEFEQCLREGRDVAGYEGVVNAFVAMDNELTLKNEAALEALEQLREENVGWAKDVHVWLYRGAWMEWELGRVDMAVPLSPGELIKKRHAIFRHLSQKDIVPFPGDDPREFWQRAEERTQNTAKLYDELGMAEYQAIEVFLKLY